MQELKVTTMKKSTSQKLKDKRTRLYKINPFCPDCECKMILPEDIGFKILENGNKILKHHPDNLCTIEHKYTKVDPRRKQPANNEIRHTLLCTKCNKSRGKKDYNKRVRIEEKWARSGKFPKKYRLLKILLDRIKNIGYICGIF